MEIFDKELPNEKIKEGNTIPKIPGTIGFLKFIAVIEMISSFVYSSILFGDSKIELGIIILLQGIVVFVLFYVIAEMAESVYILRHKKD